MERKSGAMKSVVYVWRRCVMYMRCRCDWRQDVSSCVTTCVTCSELLLLLCQLMLVISQLTVMRDVT